MYALSVQVNRNTGKYIRKSRVIYFSLTCALRYFKRWDIFIPDGIRTRDRMSGSSMHDAVPTELQTPHAMNKHTNMYVLQECIMYNLI